MNYLEELKKPRPFTKDDVVSIAEWAEKRIRLPLLQQMIILPTQEATQAFGQQWLEPVLNTDS